MDSSIVENENILERALRTYEESERSLKSICNSVEQENIQLEEQFANLENHQKNLVERFHFLQQRIEQIRQEYQHLNEKQFLFTQQTNQYQQRSEQIQSAIQQILSSAISSSNESSIYPLLRLKLIPIEQEDKSSSKRKLTTNDFETKSQKRNSSVK